MATTIDKPLTDKAVLEARLKGFTYEEIGQHHGVTRQAVSSRMKGIFRLVDGGALELYRENRIAVLESLELQVLSELSKPGKLQKATANNLGYVFSQVHNARRLESGESTANLSLAAVVAQARGGPSDPSKNADTLA